MKKCFVFISVLILLFSSLYAVEDDSLLQSDETQKTYERKAVLGMGEIGFSQDSVRVPMRYCEINKEGKGRCVPWSFNVNYRLGREEKIKAARSFYQWTITNRFDKMVIGGDKAFLSMKRSDLTVDLNGRVPDFVSETENFASYQKRLEHYLNSDMKETFGALLDSSVEARYAELPEREQETFITTKAKELGISAEFIKTLLNSSYVFAAHVAPIGGAGKVIRSTLEDPLTHLTYYSFDVEIELSLDVKFLIYHYDPETKMFEKYGEIIGESGTVSGSTYTGLRIIPTPAQVMGVFNEAFQTAIKAASINANMKLKKDDNFALFMPVKTAKGKKIETDFGVMEDIRVDHPFSILETVNGKTKRKGWARARDVAKNCTDDSDPTVIKVTNGSAEEGDLMREHPWTGLYFNLGFETNSVLLSGESEEYDAGSMFAAPGVRLGVDIDLGYAMNSRALSEFYFSAFLDLDFGLNDSDTVNDDVLVWMGGGLGIAKRFYTGSAGFFIAPALDVSYHGTVNSDWNFQRLALTPQLHFGFSATPDFDFIIKAGWNLGFLTKAEKGDEYSLADSYSGFAHGLFAGIDLNFHLPVVGGMARFYKAPSNVCKVKK